MPDASTMTIIERRQRRICHITTSNQMTKVCSSLLVPLMIGVFTIVTTVLQMNLANQQRDQDLQIAKDNREKDYEIANKTRVLQNQIEESRLEQEDKIEENRREAEANAQKDHQMNSVLAAYLKDMTELMLSRKFNLTNQMISTVIRAKTLTTLGQLDGKRKAHLVRFLYETQMISVEQPSINLADADLSYVDLTNYKLIDVSFAQSNLIGAIFRDTDLTNVNFTGVRLGGASFHQCQMINITFDKANLSNTSFIGARLHDVYFQYAIITDADFTRISASSHVNWFAAKGNNTIFNEADMLYMDFTRSNLINASFVKIRNIYYAVMSNAILYQANFTDIDMYGANFAYVNLYGSIFDRSKADATTFYAANLQSSKWFNTTVRNVDFSFANLLDASITDNQIQQAWTVFGAILPNGIKGEDVNLLQNGGAEYENGTCRISPWNVNFMTTARSDEMVWHMFGQCHFIKQFERTEATMHQRVKIPEQYEEWVRADMAFIRITGYCMCYPNFALYARQFSDNSSLPLVNNRHNERMILLEEVLFPAHPAMTEVELEIVCQEDCRDAYGCGTIDKLKLTIWHRNYTLPQ